MGVCMCPPGAKHDMSLRCHSVYCNNVDRVAKARRERQNDIVARAYLTSRFGSLQFAKKLLGKYEGRRTKQTTESFYVRIARHAKARPPTRASARLRNLAGRKQRKAAAKV
jgi:hypothetical protein